MSIRNFHADHDSMPGSNLTMWPKAIECSDVLCLVQAILSKTPQIVLTADIDVSGTQFTKPTSNLQAELNSLKNKVQQKAPTNFLKLNSQQSSAHESTYQGSKPRHVDNLVFLGYPPEYHRDNKRVIITEISTEKCTLSAPQLDWCGIACTR